MNELKTFMLNMVLNEVQVNFKVLGFGMHYRINR